VVVDIVIWKLFRLFYDWCRGCWACNILCGCLFCWALLLALLLECFYLFKVRGLFKNRQTNTNPPSGCCKLFCFFLVFIHGECGMFVLTEGDPQKAGAGCCPYR